MRTTQRRLTLASTLAFTLSALPLSAAIAATFTPTRFDDPAPNGCQPTDCSLREAVIAANALAGTDRISLSTGTYALTRLANGVTNDERVGALWLRDDVEIVGQGTGSASGTLIRWSPATVGDKAIFHAWAARPVKHAWRRLRVTHGKNVGRNGGCFELDDSASSYTLEQVHVRNCEASAGGAIAVNGSTLRLTSSFVDYNLATGDGGGILMSYDSSLVTRGSTIKSNSAGRDGGGVAFVQATLTGANVATWTDDGFSRVESNGASRHGGGIAVYGDLTLEIDGHEPGGGPLMQVRDNYAGVAGGGLHRGERYVALGEQRLKVRQLAVHENYAPWGAGLQALEPISLSQTEFRGNATTVTPSSGSGGAVHLDSNAASDIFESSFYENDAGNYAGGAIYSNGCGPLALSNVSLYANRASRAAAVGVHGQTWLYNVTAHANVGTFQEIYNYSATSQCPSGDTFVAYSLITDRCSPRHVSNGGNQYGPDATACPAVGTDQRQASSAVFALTLGSFGAAFQGLGWNAGSAPPQQDYANPAGCATIDWRGVPRPVNGACDSGAFEFKP